MEELIFNFHNYPRGQLYCCLFPFRFPGGAGGRESAYNAGDLGLIPGSGRSPGEVIHSSILAWEIPWTEEPGGLQSMGSQKGQTT